MFLLHQEEEQKCEALEMELEGARSDFRVSWSMVHIGWFLLLLVLMAFYTSLYYNNAVHMCLCMYSVHVVPVIAVSLPQDLNQQLDQAESQIKLEQQKRADAEEDAANLRDQLGGVKSALGSQVMELDRRLKASQEQCTQLETEKVGHYTPHYIAMCQCYVQD